MSENRKTKLLTIASGLCIVIGCLLVFSVKGEDTPSSEAAEAESEAQTPDTSELTELLAQYEDQQYDVMDNGSRYGHDYVDLGLPSGLKWAACNVGASVPEEYGNYFAWGGVKPDTVNCLYAGGTYYKRTDWLEQNGFINTEGVLTPEHDAVTVNWGGTWRLPTIEEYGELLDNTVGEWTTLNDVWGYLLTSNTNGNTIFLPAAGTRNSVQWLYQGHTGTCWSSTIYEKDPETSCCVYFSSYNIHLGEGFRNEGRPVTRCDLLRPFSFGWTIGRLDLN